MQKTWTISEFQTFVKATIQGLPYLKFSSSKWAPAETSNSGQICENPTPLSVSTSHSAVNLDMHKNLLLWVPINNSNYSSHWIFLRWKCNSKISKTCSRCKIASSHLCDPLLPEISSKVLEGKIQITSCNNPSERMLFWTKWISSRRYFTTMIKKTILSKSSKILYSTKIKTTICSWKMAFPKPGEKTLKNSQTKP